jgi:hypothetical protein
VAELWPGRSGLDVLEVVGEPVRDPQPEVGVLNVRPGKVELARGGAGVTVLCRRGPQDCHAMETGTLPALSPLYVAIASCRLDKVSSWPWIKKVGTRTWSRQ